MKKILLTLMATASMAASALAADVKPAIIYDLGGKFDKSFNEAAYNGAEKFKAETGIEYREFEIANDAQREQALRKFAGDGLFTAFSEEPNWGKAHRILLPAFSQRAMRGYFDMIVEVCDALIAKWTRLSGTDVLVADDMTRLTLDSIAIAGFGHRFDSFAREELDSFLVALGRALAEALSTITRLPLQQRFARRAQAQYEADIAEMNALVDGIIADRTLTTAHPPTFAPRP